MTVSLDCLLVGLAVLVLAFMNWQVGRMIERRLEHMDDRLGSMDGRFGSMQDMLRDALVTMNNTMAGIQRFLDRQDRQPGPAE